MADSAISFLLQYLPEMLAQEANFLVGVENEVSSLHRELSLINVFLNDCGGERREHGIVKQIYRQIRDVAYEAEDIIDTFILKVAEHRRRSVMERIFRSPSHTMMLRNVGRKIVLIKNEINEVYNNKEKYRTEKAEVGVTAAAEEAWHRHRREVEEDEVVGFVHDSKTLVKSLTEGNSQLDVVSIIGMGGLGKTTLAKKVYNNFTIRRHFNCCGWAYVSQNLRIRELLLEILKSLMPKSDGLPTKLVDMSEDELKEELFEYLKEKRYLVVIDDIWRTEDWNEVKVCFPDYLNGSKILITSRNKQVAIQASLTPPYFLQFLNNDESWELFKKKVFRGSEKCPPELETLGRQIAENCHGLPLSIVVLAAILENKDRTFHVWSRFVGSVNLTILQNTPICKEIMFLSYTDLPPLLQSCFLYFGVYSEGFDIPVRHLIHLWIAEGFIQNTNNRNIEDLAEDYLEELIDRNLIQVACRRTDGGVKKCRMHDLLRHLCILESAETKFLEVRTDFYRLSRNKSRRLSIQGSTPRYISSNPSDPTCARSLLFLHKETGKFQFDTQSWDWVHKNFKLLRVLHFENVELYSIPGRIETLIHLRYLKIKLSAAVKVIPDSIGNLRNLETLYVYGNLREECLPNGIFKLHCLRNLYLNGILPLPYQLNI